MRRRTLAALGGAMIVGTISGCLGTGDRDSRDVEEHLETAADHLDTAGEEFDAVSDRVSHLDDGLGYSTETVDVAIAEARVELEIAEDANPSSSQEEAINQLSHLLNALEHSATGYGTFLSMLDYFDLVETYLGADRVDDAHTELDFAEESRQLTVEELGQALDALEAYDPVDLDADLAVIHWRQRIETTKMTAEDLEYLLEGWGYRIEGWDLFLAGIDDVDAGEYEAATETFWAAHETFDQAYDVYEDGEVSADGELRHTYIRQRCEMGNARKASEIAQEAAMEFDDGIRSEGLDLLNEARDVLTESC